jgi:hypothetical protein
MDELGFQKIVKDLTVYAEVILAKKNQKQAVIDAFGKERKRFKAGKISKAGLRASVPRTKKELDKLDKSIRVNIQRLNSTAIKVKKFAAKQAPKKEKVSASGITGSKR